MAPVAPIAEAMYSARTHARIAQVDRVLEHLVARGRTMTPLAALAPKRILVLESHHLGDLVMTLPLLARLRGRYPDAEITLAAHAPAADLSGVRALVHRVVALPVPWHPDSHRATARLAQSILRLRWYRFDIALSAWGDLRDKALLWATGARRRLAPAFGGGDAFLTDPVPLPPTATHLSELRSAVLHALGDTAPVGPPALDRPPRRSGEQSSWLADPGVVVHPGASVVRKRWPLADCVAAVQQLVEAGLSVTLAGAPNERDTLCAIREAAACQGVQIAATALDDFVTMLANAQAAVTMDSAAGHLAAAVATPVVILFGPTTPEHSGARGTAPVRYCTTPTGTMASHAPANVVRQVLMIARPRRLNAHVPISP